jgi:hypothetical protein
MGSKTLFRGSSLTYSWQTLAISRTCELRDGVFFVSFLLDGGDIAGLNALGLIHLTGSAVGILAKLK